MPLISPNRNYGYDTNRKCRLKNVEPTLPFYMVFESMQVKFLIALTQSFIKKR